jgi:hypothetical protein
LRRYGKKELRGTFCNFWKWLGLFLEIFRKPRVFSEFCGLQVDYVERQGIICKVASIFGWGFIFEWKIIWTRSIGRWTAQDAVHGEPVTMAGRGAHRSSA